MTDDDKALVERLREGAVIRDDGRWTTITRTTALEREAADRIEALSAEVERLEKTIKVQASAVRTLQANEETEINMLRKQKAEWHRAVSSLDSEREANAILTVENERLIKAGDGDVGLIHWQGERIEQLEAALREIARLRTDLRGDFSLGSKQSDIARAALGETK